MSGMENQLFNLKFTAKQLSKEAKKCEKNSKSNQDKCKKAMQQGNNDGARIYAEKAIRDKNQALNYLRLSSRIDAVAQRVQTAVSMKMLTKNMQGVVRNMDTALQSMNPEKINKVMEQFEKQFEDLDIASGVMQDSVATTSAQSIPESQVDGLMQQVADEHGLEFSSEMNSLGSASGKVKVGAAAVKDKAESKTVVLGGDAASKKKAPKDDDDQQPNSGGGAAAGGGDVDDLEARLKRLTGN